MQTLQCRDLLNEIKDLLNGISIMTKAEVEDLKNHTDAIFMVMRCVTERLNAVDAHLANLGSKEQRRPRVPLSLVSSLPTHTPLTQAVPALEKPDTIALTE